MEEPQNREIAGRNIDGTFAKGFSGNPGGPPKGGLKDYDRQKFLAMTDEEKEAFLLKIAPELRYRMAEGNPDNATKLGGELQVIVNIAKEIAEQNDIKSNQSPS